MTSKKLFKNNRLQYGGAVQEGTDHITRQLNAMKEQLNAMKEQQNADINAMKGLECLVKFAESQRSESLTWRGLIVVDVQNGFIAGGSLGPKIDHKKHLKQADLIKMLYHINKDSYKVVCWSKDFHPNNHSSFKGVGGFYESHCRDPGNNDTWYKDDGTPGTKPPPDAYQNIEAVLEKKDESTHTFTKKDIPVVGADISYLFNGLNKKLAATFLDFEKTHADIIDKLKGVAYPVSSIGVDPSEERENFLNLHIRKETTISDNKYGKFIIPPDIKNYTKWNKQGDPLFVFLLKGQLPKLDSNSPFLEHLSNNEQISYKEENLLGTWLSIAVGFLFSLPNSNLRDKMDELSSNDQDLDNYVSGYNTTHQHGTVPRVVLDVCGLVTNICVAQTVIQGIIAWLKRYSICIPQIGFNVFIDLSVPLKMLFKTSPVNFYKPYNYEYDEQFPLNNIDKKRDTNENNETTDNLIDFYRNALQAAINLNKISEAEMQKIKNNVSINIILAGFGPIKFDMELLQHTSSTVAPGDGEQGDSGQAGNPGQGYSGQAGGSAHNSTCNCNQCSATYRKKYLKYKKKYLEYK